jgi:peptide-methionine (S)-S-oxide reductase
MVKSETITLAGGCFWCLDAVFRRVTGVNTVSSGFSGGHVKHPKYEQIHAQDTGHAEAVQIVFQPNKISLEVILQIFWTAHDPSKKNQDGANIGPQYRSEIFYHSYEQKQTAETVLNEFARPLWNGRVSTKITKLTNFYPAEDYHQDYYNKNQRAGYCQVIINPKISKVKENFAKYFKT